MKLGKQDTKTFNLYNSLLALLANGEMMIPDICDAIGLEPNGTLRRMKALVGTGFAIGEKRIQGHYNQKTWFYRALRTHYPLDEFIAMLEVRDAYKHKSKTTATAVEKPSTPSHIYIFNIDEKRDGNYIHQSKYNQQAKSLKKKPVYGISGSSMSMF
jgi:hypothetical protein